MEKNRQTKIIAILALVVAVVGMSLGFAAFSNILTISSSATVMPNSEDFKMVAYGLAETIDGDAWWSNKGDLSLYTSKTSGMPILGGSWNLSKTPLDYEIATIIVNEGQISLTNLGVTFEEPGEYIIYPFAIKNEGAYDAYVTAVEEVGTKTCTAGQGTTQSLMEEACENINYRFYAETTTGKEFDPSNMKVAPGESVIIYCDLSYYNSTDVARADGSFNVVFPDAKITMSTAAAN